MPTLASATTVGSSSNSLSPGLITRTLSSVLEQAQRTSSTHRKNLIILYKLFTACSKHTEELGGGRGTRLVGEKWFVDAFKNQAINRILVIRKGVVQADRVVKFLCGFISHAVQEAAKQTTQEDDEDEDPAETSATRLTSSILRHLLKGFSSKDKNVRFRSTQFVALLITGLGELDDTDYQSLLSSLLKRVNDKESSIRVQAIVALGKLQNPEDLNDPDFVLEGDDAESDDEQVEEDEEETLKNPTRTLVKIMKRDPSAEVRRAALFQLDVHPSTLPSILSRQRDVDPLNRRLLYTNALAELPGIGVLTLQQREDIVRFGLKDREEGVRRASGRLIANWAKKIADDLVKERAEGGEASSTEDIIDGSVAFLNHFNILVAAAETASGTTSLSLPEEALQAVYNHRPEIAGQLAFSDAFWKDLDPQRALLAKSFIAYCRSVNDELRLDACLPVLTSLSFLIQDRYAVLSSLLRQIAHLPNRGSSVDGESEDTEEQLLADLEGATFTTTQLMSIAVEMDYQDELGRRKMFSLIRDMVSDPTLPAELISPCMDVLLKLSTGEKDFMQVVVEIVQNVREDANAALAQPATGEDEEMDDEDDEEEELDLDTATPEDLAEDQRKRRERIAKKVQKAQGGQQVFEQGETALRCLALVKALLARVVGSLADNPSMTGLVHELIVPSVKSKEPLIREQGLMCLGLCCLLDKSMALESFGLFVHQSQATEGQLQIDIFRILFDILMLYGLDFLSAQFGHGADKVIEFLLHALNQPSHEISATAAIGIAKLMLSGMVDDSEVLKSLVLVYFAPETASNLALRQCLSYFFPVYCYSLSAHQKRMAEVFLPSYLILSGVYEELDEESRTEMVNPAQVLNQMLDWTDPNKTVDRTGGDVTASPKDEEIQVDLAIDVLKLIFKETKKDSRKSLCQLLNKLYFPDSLDEWKLKNTLLLCQQLELHRPLTDSVSRNALTKFTGTLTKRFPERASVMDEADFAEFEQLHSSVAFLEEIKQENEEKNGDEDGAEEEMVNVAQTKAAAGRGRGRGRGKATTRGRGRGARAGSVASRVSETPSVEPEEVGSTSPRRSSRAPKPVSRTPQAAIPEESEQSSSASSDESESDAAEGGGNGDPAEESDSDEEDDESIGQPAPSSRQKQGSSRKSTASSKSASFTRKTPSTAKAKASASTGKRQAAAAKKPKKQKSSTEEESEEEADTDDTM